MTEELLALPQRFAEYTESTDEKLDALFRETRQNTNHIGELKGMFMERTVREDGAIIANDMGLQWRKTLERSEVVQIADQARLSGAATDIPRDHMRAFVRADLIFEATDRSGNETYVAVEISYTADERDTDRARRHAEYLTRFTGTPAYAAIASVHIDNRIADIVTEDNPQPHGATQETKVFWSRLPGAGTGELTR